MSPEAHLEQLRFDDFFARHLLCDADLFPTQLLELTGGALAEWLRRHPLAQTPPYTSQHPSQFIGPEVYVHPDATVEPGVSITGPCVIAAGASVRHGAYLRGSVYLGPEAVIGHTSEAKNAVLLDGAKAAHFAYVGDSLLGYHCNLGAGTKIANLRFDRRPVSWRTPTGVHIPSGRHKLGAIVGDRAQTGCNAVLAPGTVLLPGSHVPPCTFAKGLIT